MGTGKKVNEEKIDQVDKVFLSIKHDLYEKALKKSQKLDYINLQEYITELIRRDANRKKAGGHPVEKIKMGKIFTMKKVLTRNGKFFKV